MGRPAFPERISNWGLDNFAGLWQNNRPSPWGSRLWDS